MIGHFEAPHSNYNMLYIVACVWQTLPFLTPFSGSFGHRMHHRVKRMNSVGTRNPDEPFFSAGRAPFRGKSAANGV
jgi:hypothetical protein